MSPRDRILARRAKFIAAAVASAGAIACSSTSSEQVCLQPLGDAGGDTSTGDTGTRDTSTSTPDTGPTACLTPALDSGVDTGPTPCLEPPLEDTGSADTGPTPCLKMAPDSGAD